MRSKHPVVLPQKNSILHSAMVLNIDMIALDCINKKSVLLFECSAVSQYNFRSLCKIRYTRPFDAGACTHPHTFVHTQTCLHTHARAHCVCVCVCVCTLFPLVCSKVRRDTLLLYFLSVFSFKVWL